MIEGGELPDPPSLYEGSQLELIEPVLPQKEKTEGWSFGYFQTTAKNFLGTAMEKTNIVDFEKFKNKFILLFLGSSKS